MLSVSRFTSTLVLARHNLLLEAHTRRRHSSSIDYSSPYGSLFHFENLKA